MTKFKFLRQELLLSQYEMAAAIGVPRWRLQLLELGHDEPTQFEKEMIAKVLGVSLDTIFPRHINEEGR